MEMGKIEVLCMSVCVLFCLLLAVIITQFIYRLKTSHFLKNYPLLLVHNHKILNGRLLNTRLNFKC